jgi:hypothetical protein
LYVIELVIIIEYEHLFTNEVQKFCWILLRSSRPISELGNVIVNFATNLGIARWNNDKNQMQLQKMQLYRQESNYLWPCDSGTAL